MSMNGTTHIVNNNILVNLNQEYANIILAVVSILLYLQLLLCDFSIVHVNLMY